MQTFTPGQRYFNAADLQLGLGRVLEENHRMVRIAFNAVEETRVFAKDNAPLTRLILSPGDALQHREGWSMKITAVETRGALLHYTGVTASGDTRQVAESELADEIRIDQPLDRLLNGQIDGVKMHRLRALARDHRLRLLHSDLYGLIGCRTALLPHQLYIAHAVCQRLAPRVLLADEVGLGKTIEAGLIVHRQLLRGVAERVLVVVPETLIHQWMVEMLRKFNLHFSVLDGEKIEQIEASGGMDNPFEASQLTLLPLEWLTASPERVQALTEAGWDLLVVDEAHHLYWSPEAPSAAYQVVEQLATAIDSVLLLTATPEQLGQHSHFARLRLLDPHRYSDFERFKQEESDFQPIAAVVARLADATELKARELADMAATLAHMHASESWQAFHAAPNDAAHRSALIDALLDRHGTGRVLFRNTRHSIENFPVRELHAEPLSWSPMYRECDVLYPEQALPVDADVDWCAHDPRVAWLLEFIQAKRDAKVLLIAHHATTVLQLAEHLKRAHGISAAVFHEGMDLIARDQAAARFADLQQGTQLLLCSEIGSEGRNFQFAHHLVCFDLPDNPDLLEQRIGRLDRIGQSRTIHIHVPYFEHSVQAHWFAWYHHGMHLFERTNPAAFSVYQRLLDDFLKAAAAGDSAAVIAETQAQSAALLAAMHSGRDRLLEYNSCRQPQADHLCQRAHEAEHVDALMRFMHLAFDVYGVHHEEHRARSEILRPTEQMVGHFPHLFEEGMTVTWHRDVALANENMHYLSWEHPMVAEVMDMILSQEIGNSACVALKGSGLEAGQLFLEAVYRVESGGRWRQQSAVYLNEGVVTLVLDESGQPLSDTAAARLLSNKPNAVPVDIAVQVLRARLSVIKDLMQGAEALAESRCAEIRAQALESARTEAAREQARLKELSEVNPNIRADEIQAQQAHHDALIDSVQRTGLQLDAVRLLVTL